ncbi:hypothetical protein [Streptomyces sp. 1222.5]|uniref:hypothetical protein n=1 Tax=Streptomyces sp. 1222.5 TaxID=1881026 RepID=UPI003D740511
MGKIQGLADSEWRKGFEAHLANAIGPRPSSDAGANTAWTVLDGVYEKIRYALEELKSAQETSSGVMATHEGQEGWGGGYSASEFRLDLLRTGEGGPQYAGRVWGHMILQQATSLTL